MMNDFYTRYSSLLSCKTDIDSALDELVKLYERGGKLLLCGNGGSAADCEHIVGELMKGFLLKRELSDEEKRNMQEKFSGIDDYTLSKLQGGLPAISLTSIGALNTAVCNDIDAELLYAQALFALADSRDCLLAISTSGNARNVLKAVEVARSLGITVIGLSGEKGGELAKISDVCIRVPENETYKVQELHLPIYHYLCAKIEEHFFS